MTNRFEKRVLADLERCYAVRAMTIAEKQHLLYATEGYGACLQFDADTFRPLSPVWEQPGGTMSIIPIPGKEGDFLAVQNFFPTFQSENATIVWGHLNEQEQWEIHPFIHLPYVHRFDLLQSPTGVWFVGCTLCTSKKDKEDWADPGKIWVGQLPDSWDKPMPLTSILEPMTRNHGYCRLSQGDLHQGVATCNEGVFLLTPPQSRGNVWQTKRLLDKPVSDVAFVDIDGDGKLECISIEPFHGEGMSIYRWEDDQLRHLWDVPFVTPFGHVVWGGQFEGVPTFIAACRKGRALLMLIRWNGRDGFDIEVVDEGQGPSNIDVTTIGGKDVILSANRMIGQAVIYQSKE